MSHHYGSGAHPSDADIDTELVLRIERARGRNRPTARWERDVWNAYVDPVGENGGPHCPPTSAVVPA